MCGAFLVSPSAGLHNQPMRIDQILAGESPVFQQPEPGS